jgi:trehalose 6-phosphate phosphatase
MPTLQPLWLSLDTIARRMRSANSIAIAVDYDGTLTPIVEHPDQAALSPRARAVLERLASAPGVNLAVLSGRQIDDLRTRLGFEGAFLAGAGGLETLDAAGHRHTHVPPGQGLPPELEPMLAAWCARFEGAWLEAKGPAMSLHFRAVSAAHQPAFCSGVRRRLARFRSGARLVHGKKVFDVLPAIAWDKASVIPRWLGSGPPPDLLFYFGDDTLDEPVYDLISSHPGGYAVAVDRIASRARYVLHSPADVLWFLEWLEREWGRAAGAPEPRRQRVEPVA